MGIYINTIEYRNHSDRQITDQSKPSIAELDVIIDQVEAELTSELRGSRVEIERISTEGVAMLKRLVLWKVDIIFFQRNNPNTDMLDELRKALQKRMDMIAENPAMLYSTTVQDPLNYITPSPQSEDDVFVKEQMRW